MSENSSEYLKRTCLICGCHTNQTINIYEPRSGPNIVQLIQAKFKFQPLNEDKYLCFSCNNWLINWHSLQALNSNDAESPSGTFRSHLNSGNVMHDEKSSGSKKHFDNCRRRPIALVKPIQLAEISDVTKIQQQVEQSNPASSQKLNEKVKSPNRMNFNKRNFRTLLVKRGAVKMQYKSMHQCACGKYLVVRVNNRLCVRSPTTQTVIKCRKCRELSQLKACYLRSIVQVEKELAQREAPLKIENNIQNLVIETEIATTNESQSKNQQLLTPTPSSSSSSSSSSSLLSSTTTPLPLSPPQLVRHNYLPKPTVDGKVVSMLRRLGTTLTREPPQQNGSTITTTNTLPQIMSPPKPQTKWLRPLENDEILLNFDSSISEVLNSLTDQFTHVNTSAARKRLTFQCSQTANAIDLCDADISESEEVDELSEIVKEHENCIEALNLPKSLTITLA